MIGQSMNWFWGKLKQESVQKAMIFIVAVLLIYGIIVSALGAGREKASDVPEVGGAPQTFATSQFFGVAKERSDGLDDALNSFARLDKFFTSLYRARDIYTADKTERDFATREFMENVLSDGFAISKEDATALVIYPNARDIYTFEDATGEILATLLKQVSSPTSVANNEDALARAYKGKFIPDLMKRTGASVLKTISAEFLKESTIVPPAYRGKLSGLGIVVLLTLLMAFMGVLLKGFFGEVFRSRQKLLMLALIFVVTLLIGRWVAGVSTVAIPVFIGGVLIAVLMDPILALVVNLVLTLTISLIVPMESSFLMMSLLSGSFAAYISGRAHRKNRLFLSGLIIGAINVLIVVSVGFAQHDELNRIGFEAFVAFVNGVGSIIIAIGLLPFFEGAFNIVTPVKLLEILNPNQPLIKRLMVEAPGTYHHSLMVGNLSEAAANAIGANALLARAGSYYHDVGKLLRPDFFMENQMGENPHDRLTPNLSSLIITAHTNDGYELALKHKIPAMVRDIIREHHGTTLVAYFYNKAKNGEKGELVTEESFRYSGPKPSSIESAVVMLADSVEAAVRALPDKTEGKIEGLIRKIIKGKLEDGQLVQCNLTLKDLETIGNSFLEVFGGYFHAREEYPHKIGSPTTAPPSSPSNSSDELEGTDRFPVPYSIERKMQKEGEGDALENTG